MSLNDPLANTLSKILNCEKSGKKECLVRPSSKIIIKVLEILKKENYIKDFELVESNKGGVIKINLSGSINKCNAIKPRFSYNKDNAQKFEKRYLPAKDFGIIILSTTKGIMTHSEAKDKNIGGTLLAYCY